jgi:hypothetical protein
MSDPSFATMQFAQQMVRPDLLTGIGQGLRGIQEQINTRDLEGQYNMALQQVYQNPTNDNISRLYQLSEPLGRFQNARAAVNDLFGRMPEPGAGEPVDMNPNLAAYNQAFEAWRQDPMNEDLRNDLYLASQAPGVDRFSDTQKIVEETVGNRTNDANWQAYQAAQEAYRRDPSYDNEMAVISAAQKVGGDAASTIGTLLADLDSRRTETERQAAQTRREAEFNSAQRAFREAPTSENYDALFRAAMPLGYLDEMTSYVNTLSTEQRVADVQQGMSILSPLSVNDAEGALEAVNGLITNSTDEQEIAELERIRKSIEQGDIEGAREQLFMAMGAYPEGREILDTMLEFDANRRAEDVTGAQLLSMTMDLEFDSEEQKQHFLEQVDGLPYGIAEALSKFARVAVEDPGAGTAAQNDLLDREADLRREYEGYVKNYRTVATQFANIEAVYDLDNPSGMGDQAFITLYNKVLDPTSVVRESEAARTLTAAGWFRNADERLQGFINNGIQLDPQARADVVRAARELARISQEETDRYRNLINETVKVIDPDGSLGSVDRIFRETPSTAAQNQAFRDHIDAVIEANGIEDKEEFYQTLRLNGITTIEQLDAELEKGGWDRPQVEETPAADGEWEDW